MKNYGSYGTGGGSYGTDRLDNVGRDTLFEEIVSRTANISKEDFKKDCMAANMIETEIEDLNYLIGESRMKTKNQPPENL